MAASIADQLVTEAIGPGWICTSLIAAISLKVGVPQALHQDEATVGGGVAAGTERAAGVEVDEMASGRGVFDMGRLHQHGARALPRSPRPGAPERDGPGHLPDAG